MSDTRGIEHRVAKQKAVAEALTLFGKIWQRKFNAHAIAQDLGLWVDACESAATAFVVPAAKKLVASARSGTYPPKPADLSEMARLLERQAAPEVLPRGGDGPLPLSNGTICGKDTDAVDRLSRQAYARLGSWPLVSEVWGLLWKTATTDDERAAVRNGWLPEDVFDEALRVVSAQAGAA
jgi:hypothetical protein